MVGVGRLLWGEAGAAVPHWPGRGAVAEVEGAWHSTNVPNQRKERKEKENKLNQKNRETERKQKKLDRRCLFFGLVI